MQTAERDAVIEQYLAFVKPIARRLRLSLPPSISIDDLEQLGALGLIEAAGKFDPARADTFAAYAKCRIRGAMLDGIKGREYREATHEELDATHHQVADMQPTVEDNVILIDERERRTAAIAECTPRQRKVLELRAAGMTQAAAGRELGITQVGARLLEMRAVDQVRKRLAA